MANLFCSRCESSSSMFLRVLFLLLASFALQSCTVRATHEAGVFHFETLTSPWSSCYHLNSSLSCYRTRETICVRSSDNVTAPWYYCTDRGQHRPTTVQECVEEGSCQQNCAVSLWSAWSNCDCSQNLYRNRTRKVISPPRNGGLPCPALMEREACPCAFYRPFDTQPRRHTWKTESWSPCRVLNASSQCGVGLKSRAVLCVNLEGQTVNNASCLQETAYSSLIPPSSQTHCELPCPCVLGEWGSFSSCIPQCDQQTPTGIQTRSRPVMQAPTLGLSCANTEENRTCTLNENVCPIYIWSTSGWSPCNFQTGASCGNGHSTRFVYCLEIWNGTMTNVDFSQCAKLSNTSRPTEIMACTVSCPQACLVGEWSDWTQCPRTCQQAYSNRTRSIIVPPVQEVCPHILEFRPCPALPCARWLPREYTDCVAFPCGQGSQSRTIDCVGPNNDIIQERSCDPRLRPEPSIDCHVPCPNDCVVSDWSQWSPCSETCGGHVGNRTRMRYLVVNGTTCPYTDADLLETSSCSSDEECVSTIYFVQQLPWSECVPEKVVLNSSGSPPTDNQLYQFDEFGYRSSCSEDGTHNRTSICFKGYQVIPESECPMELQSLEMQSCELPCSRECIFSGWSQFSECSASCGNMGYWYRSRHLIQFSDIGSASCTVDENGLQVESELCVPLCNADDGGVAWHTTEWSRCYLYEGFTPQGECGLGYQNRTVSCVDIETGLMVSEIECMSLLEGEPRPSAVSSCHVECAQKCLITEWSKLSSCTHGGNRMRERSIVPYRGCDDWSVCCPHLTTILLLESVDCLPSVTKTYEYFLPASYSTCIINSPVATCGNGMQHRKHVCTYTSRGAFIPVDDSFCVRSGSPRAAESKPCSIKCERDCVQTDWELWSQCSVSCGSGYRTRSRITRTPPEVGGRLCGPTLETDVCFNAPCPHVEILPGPFGGCVPSNSSLCGEGVRTRDPVCLVDGVIHECESTGLANLSFSLSEPCMAPCPGECVAGEWGEWSPCSTNCPIGSCQRQRTRAILRETLDCTDESVLDIQTCYAPVNPYFWDMGPWKDCIVDPLENHTATVSSSPGHYCGLGLRRRTISCMNGTEGAVHESLCVEAGIRRPAIVQNCSLPCPVDCIVGPFSDWTECARCILRSFQQRSRDVIIPAQFGGQECPDLVQMKNCIPTGCVEKTQINHVPLVSIDYTREGQCGSALKYEPVSCLRNTEFVSPSECLGGEIKTEKNITLPCPSEPNCTYSEWSDWSECVTLCTDRGRPFRHRYRRLASSLPRLTSACAAAQHQTEECPSEPDAMVVPGNWNGTDMMPTTASSTEPTGSCIDFAWHSSQWNRNGTRVVYCQSSTSVRVENAGCPNTIMPRSQNETCANVTCPRYAMCSDSEGVCLQTCGVNFESVQEVCLPLSGCVDHTHCLIPNMECNSLTGSCECRENFHKAEVSLKNQYNKDISLPSHITPSHCPSFSILIPPFLPLQLCLDWRSVYAHVNYCHDHCHHGNNQSRCIH